MKINSVTMLGCLALALAAHAADAPPAMMGGGLLGIGLAADPPAGPPAIDLSRAGACSGPRRISYRPPGILPAPAASAALIRQLVQKYGLTGIDGSRATLANLQRMDAVFSKFPAPCFRDLKITFERDRRWGGFWCPVDLAGNDILWDVDPHDRAPAFAGGHIYYLEDPVTRWIFTHELAHHVSIYADPALGRDLLAAFGQRVTKPATRDLSRQLQFVTAVVPEYAPASSYPTAYARNNNWQEHWAELVAYRYEHPDREYNDPILRGFRMPPQALALIESTFGAAPPQ